MRERLGGHLAAGHDQPTTITYNTNHYALGDTLGKYSA